MALSTVSSLKFLSSHISSGSMLLDFSDLVLIFTWLSVFMSVMEKWDRTYWEPVGAEALEDGIGTVRLALHLTHPTSCALHLSVILCLPRVSYSFVFISSPFVLLIMFRLLYRMLWVSLCALIHSDLSLWSYELIYFEYIECCIHFLGFDGNV